MNVLTRDTLFLFCASLLLNFFFLIFLYDDSFYRGMATSPGEIAYNVYKYNSTLINPDRGSFIHNLQEQEDRIVQYAEIDHSLFNPGTIYKYIADTVGYGIIIGLLWKVTKSLHYRDIQLLQIILYSLCLILVYGIALMLFHSTAIALACGIAHLFYFPGTYLNVHTLRDAWIYYGLIVLLYVFVRYLKNQKGLLTAIGGCSFFAWCQFIRPPLFSLLLILSCVAFCYAFFDQTVRKATILFLAVAWTTNIFFFWIPFVAYNMVAHGRAFVSTAGQNLIEGLGEFKNPWGFSVSDDNFANFMQKNYGLHCGSLECDDKARELFWDIVRTHPWFYITTLIRRLHRIFLPALPWFSYVEEQGSLTFKEKLKALPHSPHLFFDIVGRQIYIRLYLIIGYLGLLLLLIHKNYFAAMVLTGSIISSWTVFFTHVEHRYLIPYYALFSLFVGYAAYIFIRAFYRIGNVSDSTF